MIEIKPIKSLAKIDETLNRMGVSSNTVLYPTAVLIRHPETDVPYISSFKELLSMSSPSEHEEIDDETRVRTNNIVNMLVKWGLVEATVPEYDVSVDVKIIKKEDLQSGWTVVKKFTPNPMKVARAFGLE